VSQRRLPSYTYPYTPNLIYINRVADHVTWEITSNEKNHPFKFHLIGKFGVKKNTSVFEP
jgi:hypothetical protein